MLVEGPPGIGKTRLVETARDLAGAHELQLLAARATELERGVPFGVVRQLFEPIVRSGGAPLLAAWTCDGRSRAPGGRPRRPAGVRGACSTTARVSNAEHVVAPEP